MKKLSILLMAALLAVVSCKNSSSTSDGPQMVDLGLSVKWASCNLGAAKPEDSGSYFAWGSVEGQTWDGSQWSGPGFWEENVPAYEIDDQGNLKSEYDAAHVILGDSWRMPTKNEIQELIDNCDYTRIDNYNGSGVAGILFTGKKEGFTDKSIFIPASSYGLTSLLQEPQSFYGLNWSSSFDNGKAWSLSFDRNNLQTFEFETIIGMTIRPVSE